MSGLTHVVLELAREPGHPLGDRDHGYHLYLPLTTEGRIDAAAFRDQRSLCRVRRFRPGEAEAHGRVVHGPGGQYRFVYGDGDIVEDEVGFRLGTECFVPGEYVSVREDDGHIHTFQIVSCRPEWG